MKSLKILKCTLLQKKKDWGFPGKKDKSDPVLFFATKY